MTFQQTMALIPVATLVIFSILALRAADLALAATKAAIAERDAARRQVAEFERRLEGGGK